MPFFHDKDRSDLRRMYYDAWRKHRENLPMEPLEFQIAQVIEQHPEYHPVLQETDHPPDRDYRPEDGQSNPFLHMGLHLALREQVSTDRPTGIRDVHRKLSEQFGGVHSAEHRMIECLGEALWNSQRSGLPPDESAYLQALRRLAGAGK